MSWSKNDECVRCCDIDDIEKLKKYKLAYEVLKEANDFYASKDNWELGRVHSFVEIVESDKEWIDPNPPFRQTQFTGGRRAREATKKAEEILK